MSLTTEYAADAATLLQYITPCAIDYITARATLHTLRYYHTAALAVIDAP